MISTKPTSTILEEQPPDKQEPNEEEEGLPSMVEKDQVEEDETQHAINRQLKQGRLLVFHMIRPATRHGPSSMKDISILCWLDIFISILLS